MKTPHTLGFDLIESLNRIYIHDERIDTLIDDGADVNVRGDEKKTPLIVAIENGHTDAAKRLVMAGADVRACDEYGFDAVMYALRTNNAAIIEFLFTQTELKDDPARMTDALCTAIARGLENITGILIDMGADNPNAQDSSHDAAQVATDAAARTFSPEAQDEAVRILSMVAGFRETAQKNARDLKTGLPVDDSITPQKRIRIAPRRKN